MKKGFSLVELLMVIILIAILASLLLGPISKAFRRCRASIRNSYWHHNARIEAFMDENAKESKLMYYATNKIEPWIFFATNADGSFKMNSDGSMVIIKE